MVAIVLSLVINFSYLLMPIITESGLGERSMGEAPVGEHTSGILHLERDMHGYIVCDCEKQDSVYTSAWQVFNFKLKDGDHVTFTTREAREYVTGSEALAPHPRLEELYEVNGKPFDFDAVLDRPSRTVAPMSTLTVTEVKQIGHLLGLPTELVEKVPIDGLCGKTDEENLGFTYAELDVYIRTGQIDNPVKKENIDRRHKLNLFKLQLMPTFSSGLDVLA